jgi:cytochrome c
MKKIFCLLLMIVCICFFTAWNRHYDKPRVLVFSKTAGYHHESIPKGIAAIQKLGIENNFEVDSTTDASYFNDDSLSNYSTVIFLNTTGNFFNSTQRIAFERYIQAGGNYVGIHAACDAEYDWEWYHQLVGAYFLSHPPQQEARLIIQNKSHPATKYLPEVWTRKDEWYNFKQLNKNIKVLITIDEKSYTGGANGDWHPMAWYHDFDGGRAFYTALGHTDESYDEPLFLKHLLGGIQYAIGKSKKPDYRKAVAQYPSATVQ